MRSRKRDRTYHRRRWLTQAQATWDALSADHSQSELRTLLGQWSIQTVDLIPKLAKSIAADIDASVLKDIGTS